MRDNIDLTANQMFSRRAVPREFLKLVRNPFRFMESARILEDDSDVHPVIHTGNRDEREMRKLCSNIDSGDYCDCCGASLIRKPWGRHYGLCQRCAYDLDHHNTVAESKMPKYLSNKETMMQADRRKNPFRRV